MKTLTLRALVNLAVFALAAHAQTVYFGSRYQVALGSTDIQASDAPVVADFNRDGKPDIAIPTARSIAVLLGKGDGTFAAPRSIREGAPTGPILAGDFDGDGNPDIAGVSSSPPGVFILRGDGEGRFVNWLMLEAGQPYRIAAADLNGDGNLDIAVTDRSANSVRTLMNQGDGRFRPSLQSPTGPEPTFLAIADFNRDNFPDIVNVNLRERSVSFLAGVGDGTFRPPVMVSGVSDAATVLATDLGGDGNPDLAIGTMGEYIALFSGNGDGTFNPGDWYPAGGPAYLASGDLDGDGNMDLVGALPTRSRLVRFRGSGGGRFTDAEVLVWLASPSYVSLADFDGNGTPDLLVTSTSSAVVSVYLQTASGALLLTQDFGVPKPSDLVAADLNGDGKTDVAVTTIGVPGLWVMAGGGDGTLKNPVRYLAGATPVAVRAADFDHDGFPDLAAASLDSDAVAILMNRSDGTFQEARVVRTSDGCGPSSLAAADFNQDGIPDLAVGCSQNPSIEVILASAGGSFELASVLGLAGPSGAIAAGDFNGDGITDLAAAPLRGNLQVFFSNGDGTFRGPLNLASETGCTRLLAADLDGNGSSDLVLACSNAEKAVVFMASESGAFRRFEVMTGTTPLSLAVGDLTGNGTLDLAVVNGASMSVGIFDGTGTGHFVAAGELGIASSPGALAAADLTGDRQADLVVCEVLAGRVSVFVSSAGGSAPAPPIPVSPVGNTTLAQNDPSPGCTPHPINGSGVRLRLQWAPVSALVARLTVKVQRQGSAKPLMETRLNSTLAPVTFAICSYIPDGELEGWQWWIRAQDSVGNLSSWSDPGTFRFAPCRLSDSRPCGTAEAPPPAGPPAQPLKMSVVRANHTATPLRNGKVLIAGGMTSQGGDAISLATAELYDPVTRTFTPTGSLRDRRTYHTATLLTDGRVLLAGGMNAIGRAAPIPVISVEIYDPDRGTFVPFANLTAARNGHTATLLADGRVLIAGGIPGQGSSMTVAEILDPATGKVMALPPMVTGRTFHTATLLQDGRVFLYGGTGIPSAEFFIPAMSSFMPGPPPPSRRMNHQATMLDDGQILITGGLSGQNIQQTLTELFDPRAGVFNRGADLLFARTYHTATRLPDGRVLLLGGVTDTGAIVGTGEVYVRSAGGFRPGPVLTTARFGHTATLLGDGTVLVTGGMGTGFSWLDTAEIVTVPQQ